MAISVELSFDEGSGALLLFATTGAETGRQQIGSLSLSDLKALSSDEAYRSVGKALIGALNALSACDLGAEDLAAEAQQADKLVFDHLRQRVSQGDADACYHLALSYISDSLTKNDSALLEQAEVLLTRAAANGHALASSFLISTWPQTKHTRERMIRGGG